MLYHQFLTNEKRLIHKWLHYFPIYENHFEQYKNQSIVFWEIGVGEGGSLQMWKQFFGPFATIVGLDIRPECLDYQEDQINIRIGNQSDTKFLQGVIDEFGVPDVILDDGSHVMSDVCKTFDYLYNKIDKNGLYMVEDMHTAYWDDYGGGIKREGSFIELCKELIDLLNARHTSSLPHDFANSTYSMTFYDSIIAFDKKEWPNNMLKAIQVPSKNA